MARENQGLQIALIIFVMLTVVLGVTTFLFFQKCEEANKKAVDSDKAAATALEAERNAKSDVSEMRILIGHPESAEVQTMKDKFKEDMDKYAANFSNELRKEPKSYRAVLPYIYEMYDEKLADLVTMKESKDVLEKKIPTIEAAARKQAINHENIAKQAKDRLAAAQAEYHGQRLEFLKSQQLLETNWAKTRAAATAQATNFQKQLTTAEVQISHLAKTAEARTAEVNALRTETFEVPDGEIRWVNQHNGTVWINLGRADALQRQTSFSVYPIDTSNLTKAGKKASIEITQILGPHTAEARIVEDSVTDPIMPGDKIHTPIWSRGEQRRFALAGLIDLNGNGKSDLQTIRNLITMNGGVVDCYMDDNGEVQQTMTINTRYLVRGKAPDEKSTKAQQDGYTAMIGQASELHIKQISLGELLNKMGWKPQSSVVRFGRGGTPVRVKAPEGVSRVSTGTVSELFRKRGGAAARKPVRSGGAY